MSPDHHTLLDHDVEHVVSEIFELDKPDVASLRRNSKAEYIDSVVQQLVERNLAQISDNQITLTKTGILLARSRLRRHRLAEMLFSTVLHVPNEEQGHLTACVMEHVIDQSVADSVCSFLGHPKFCPHAKPIPAGDCCRSFSNDIEPLVQPLTKLTVGKTARLVYIVPKDPKRLVRLANLGIVPGVSLKLQQAKPAFVIVVGETSLAIDAEIAAEIYVRR